MTVAAPCAPEDACPGSGLATTTSGDGLVILGYTAKTFDSRNDAGFDLDCARQSGQGQYYGPKWMSKLLTAAERAALAGGDLYDGLEVQESDTGLIFRRHSSAWVQIDTIAAWPTTPTLVLKQNNGTVASTTTRSKMTRSGRTIDFACLITATAAGPGNNEVKVTPTGLPAAISNGGDPVGWWKYVDVGTGRYGGWVEWDGTDLKFWVDNVGNLGNGRLVTIANTDTLAIAIRYEAAS